VIQLNTTIQELDVVALRDDLPVEGLLAGQTGTVVFSHNNGEAFEVEFMVQPRKSIVATVPADRLLRLRGLSAA
jgi:hypothetical protein